MIHSLVSPPQLSTPLPRLRPSCGLVDVALALSWVPFAAAGWLLQDDPNRTAWLVSATLVISFAHQPLTLALVYGDKRNFDLRRRTFTWSPVVFAGAVLASQHISLTALAVVAGLWNAEHTLMQRYGIMRIHGRKAGQQDAPLDKALLFAWLALAFVWIAADGRTPGHIAQTGLRGKNRRGLDLLADLQPSARVLLPFAAVVAATLTVRWLRDEARRRRGDASWSKRFYTASTAALFVTILVDPVAGFLGYVGSHAIEYFIIVHRSVGPKYASAEVDGRAPLGYAVRRLGRGGFFAAYLAIVFGALSVLDRYGSPTSYTVVVLTVGGMHVLYDGFIWKRPAADRGGMLTVARASSRP
ncbi:MAG: hypothetical protein ACSLFP_02435 [Acidimicrobiales bacterium]